MNHKLTNSTLTLTNANLVGGITLTQSVNSGDNLLLGSCPASKIEFELMDLELALPTLVGQEFLYTIDDVNVGYFLVDTAEKIKDSGYKVTCFDRMICFDTIVDNWFYSITYPISLRNLLLSLCDHLNVSWDLPAFTNQDYMVEQRFTGEGIKGRDVLFWIAEIAGSYACFNDQGKLILGFYEDSQKSIDRTHYFDISVSDYETKPISKVQIKASEKDIGVITGEGEVAYVISQNPLLYAENDQQLRPVAEAILQKILGFCYTPFEAEVLVGPQNPTVGQFVSLTTRRESGVKSIVMNRVRKGLRETLSSTGDYEQNNLKSVNINLLKQQGKTNELERTLEQTVLRMSDVYTKDEVTTEIFNQIKITKDQLEQQISTKGGNNLIKNSSGLNGTKNWEVMKTDPQDQNAGLTAENADRAIISQTLAHSAFRLSNAKITQPFHVVAGKTYCASFLYCGSTLSAQSPSFCVVGATNAPTPLTIGQEMGDFVKVSTVFEVPADTDQVQVVFDCPGATSTLYFADLVVTYGEDTPTWCQAPNEVMTASAVLDDQGLTLDHTNSSFKGVYTSEGVHYYNKAKSGAVIAEYTADGANQGKTKIREQLTLRQEETEKKSARFIPVIDGLFITIDN